MRPSGIQYQREQLALRAGARREVERHHRLISQLPGDCQARQFDARGMVGEAALGQLVLVCAEQHRQIRAGFSAVAQLIGRHRVEPQFFEVSVSARRKSGKPATGAR